MDKYYNPNLSEFYKGFIYEQKVINIDLWADYKGQHVESVIKKINRAIRYGKEYTEFPYTTEWVTRTSFISTQNVAEQIKLGLIKVKYLDRSDIESLGFKLIDGIKPDENTPENYSWTFHKEVSPKYFEDYYIQLKYSINQCYNNKDEIVDPIHSISIRYKYLIESWETKAKASYVFAGDIKNKSELIKLLKQLNIE